MTPQFRWAAGEDFAVGRKAILFVALCKQRDGTLAYRLVGILYGDPKKPNHLDELSEQIRQAIDNGDPWTRRA